MARHEKNVILFAVIFAIGVVLSFSFVKEGETEGFSREAEIGDVGTPSSVSISTSAWTLVPASADGNMPKRSGIIVDNPSTNSAGMQAIITTSSTAPTISTNTRPIELKAADSPSTIGLGHAVFLWVVSSHTAAELLHYIEYRQ